jgi:uncharacterized oligopeptide transporter (OPT) family protein
MIGIGLVVGAVLIFIDEMLGIMKVLRIPPLAVGIGIYLPMSATFAVIVGAVIGHWYEKRVAGRPNADRLQRLGVLVASGMIVGESLFGVVNSGLIVALKNEAPLALVGEDFAAAWAIGLVSFVALIALLYGWMLTRSGESRPATARG